MRVTLTYTEIKGATKIYPLLLAGHMPGLAWLLERHANYSLLLGTYSRVLKLIAEIAQSIKNPHYDNIVLKLRLLVNESDEMADRCDELLGNTSWRYDPKKPLPSDPRERHESVIKAMSEFLWFVQGATPYRMQDLRKEIDICFKLAAEDGIPQDVDGPFHCEKVRAAANFLCERAGRFLQVLEECRYLPTSKSWDGMFAGIRVAMSEPEWRMQSIIDSPQRRISIPDELIKRLRRDAASEERAFASSDRIAGAKLAARPRSLIEWLSPLIQVNQPELGTKQEKPWWSTPHAQRQRRRQGK